MLNTGKVMHYGYSDKLMRITHYPLPTQIQILS